MNRRAEAGGRHAQRARLRLGQRDQLLYVADRKRFRNHQQQGGAGQQGYRREILFRVVRQLVPEQAGIDRERAVDDADRVAIGRGSRNRLGTDEARPAAPVVNEE